MKTEYTYGLTFEEVDDLSEMINLINEIDDLNSDMFNFIDILLQYHYPRITTENLDERLAQSKDGRHIVQMIRGKATKQRLAIDRANNSKRDIALRLYRSSLEE